MVKTGTFTVASPQERENMAEDLTRFCRHVILSTDEDDSDTGSECLCPDCCADARQGLVKTVEKACQGPYDEYHSCLCDECGVDEADYGDFAD